MKNLVVTLCLLLCVSLIGCSSASETNTNSSSDSVLESSSQTVSDPVVSKPVTTKISEEQAIDIASEHWGIKSGDVDEETGFSFLIMPVESENENYLIALKWLVENSHYSTVDTVEIDAFSGEIVSDDSIKNDEYNSFNPVGVSIIENIDGSTREIAISDTKKVQKLWNIVDKALEDINDEQVVETDTSYIYMMFYNGSVSESKMFGVFTIYKNGSCCVGEDFATLYQIIDGKDIYTELLQEIKDYN